MIKDRFAALQARVAAAAKRSSFRQGVRILPVTKTVDAGVTNDCIAAQVAAGLSPIIGESYVADFLKKREFLQGGFQAHFIGPLQDSAISKVVRVFDVVQSVHSGACLTKVAKEARKLKKQLSIFLQVNISNDDAKQGAGPSEVRGLVELARSEGLAVIGLMTITRDYETPEAARGDYARLRQLRDEVLPGGELSMGMSFDFEVAIEEGATLVRVGSALFSA